MRIRPFLLLGLLPALTACSPDVMQVVDAVLVEVQRAGDMEPSPGPSLSPRPPATAVPSLSPIPAATPSMSVSPAGAEAKQVLSLVNAARGKAGLKPMALSDALNEVAAFRCRDMAERDYFSHDDPDGNDPYYWLDRYGVRYSTAGENIALGQDTPSEVMTSWMNSPGHRANILEPRFGRLGVGLATNGEGRRVWTQLFTD